MREQDDRKPNPVPGTVNHAVGGAIQDTKPTDLLRQREERDREQRGNAGPTDEPGFGQGA